MKWYEAILNLLHGPLIKRHHIDPYHTVLPMFKKLVEQISDPRVLEIGARNVTGVTHRRDFPAVRSYTGFDIHGGDGVDVVGDAHKLSDYFRRDSIDAVLCVSVFEHLIFPWAVVLQINRILKPGGYVYISTHPTWPPHELPWDFWRYQIGGLSALFSAGTGFEVLQAAEGLPCRIYSLVPDPPTRALYQHTAYLGVALIAKKVADYNERDLVWNIDTHAAVNSCYPLPRVPS